jgi:hypothetical protein
VQVQVTPQSHVGPQAHVGVQEQADAQTQLLVFVLVVFASLIVVFMKHLVFGLPGL